MALAAPGAHHHGRGHRHPAEDVPRVLSGASPTIRAGPGKEHRHRAIPVQANLGLGHKISLASRQGEGTTVTVDMRRGLRGLLRRRFSPPLQKCKPRRPLCKANPGQPLPKGGILWIVHIWAERMNSMVLLDIRNLQKNTTCFGGQRPGPGGCELPGGGRGVRGHHGESGSGKTTLLNILAALTGPPAAAYPWRARTLPKFPGGQGGLPPGQAGLCVSGF